jgi:competence protein ComEA
MERNRLGIVLFMLVLTAVALGLYALQLRNAGPITITPVQTELRDIRVYITGAVAEPGVYPASSGERIGDVVARAGGLTAEADQVAINLARRTRDEMHIHIPVKGETAQASASDEAPSPLRPININTATQRELEALPGIGEVTARRILAAREADGPFASVDDLRRADVRESVIEQIRSLVVAE